MKKKAIIISIKGYKLTRKERSMLSKEKPWGVILFKRNINNMNGHFKLFTFLNFKIKAITAKRSVHGNKYIFLYIGNCRN